jgi:hypothetical protein
MAQTGKLGTVDSQLANLQLAFTTADPALPSVTTESGRFGGQLGEVVLGLGGMIGASVIHLAAETVLAAAQTADPAPTFAPHASPLWALGGQDCQLGDTELAFAGADAEPPTITTQSGRLGVQLGGLVPGLGGLVGAGVIHLSAESLLAIAQTVDPDPTFAPHLSPAWVLGGRDAQLGAIEPAFAGAEEGRPETDDQTGQLGTLNSLLGNMRPALGEQEGGGGANILYASAESDLLLSTDAGTSAVRTCAASSALVLLDAAGRNNLLSGAAESTVSLGVAADFTVARAAEAESTLALVDAAGRNNLLSGAAESPISLDVAAGFTAAWAVAGESTLVLTDAAANIGGQLIEAAAESTLVLDVVADFAVARAAAAESALALADAAGRNDLLSVGAESAISLDTAAEFAVARAAAADSALALADAAGRNNLLSASAESALSLTVEAARVLPAVIDVAAESAISLTGAAGRNNIIAAAATSTLDLTSAATCIHVVPTLVSAESAVSLDTAAAASVARTGWAWDWIPLWDWATVTVVRKVAAQSPLALVQTEVTARPWYLSVATPVQNVTEEYDPQLDRMVERIEGLQDVASVALPRSLTINQPIPLGQAASVVKVKATAIDVSAESVLDLLGEIRTNQLGNAGTWLAFTQSAAVDRCKLVRSALALTAEAAVARSGQRGAVSSLGLHQSATYYLVSAGVLQRYHPFVGAGEVGALTTPPLSLEGPRPGVTASFQLVYPASGPTTDSVTLRAPNFGNKDRLGFNRVLRETRGGTLIVFADPIWPKIQTLVLNFSGLTSDQTQQLLAFLDAHLGEEVGVYDWEHRYWTGVITTPTEPVVQDGHDRFSASFEFEGELVPA